MLRNNVLVVLLSAGIAGVSSADVISETNSTALEWGISGTNGNPVEAGPATLYPSGIAIAGASGAITDINITLNFGSHTWADDMEIALRSPSGTVVEIWNDAGGNADISGEVTFDDQAAAPIEDTPADQSINIVGSYQTSVYQIGSNNPLADGTLLSLFNGEDANGTWELFVYDDALGDSGSFANGWTLDIVTVPAPVSATLLVLGGIATGRRRR